ncbi:ARM repeat-containing protein [Epithele typhae]|uniref:ARM repeat-containing protein n=1 Tax=Epithele typhae TaxID=378194 RepID=UPI00200895E9|nr:ARM repeat-containing protein [Epithele typhae]KAH9945906.1 ARM repeat-containing protein [Epithele typhae]
MNVPFSSSGAMSRAHYALVRKIESASPHAADQILLAEVHSIRNQLTRSTLTLKQCKECLILLLYCSMAINPGAEVDLAFALPHALNLAEAGQTTQDKRTGYLFCAEVMPPEHELQLMLVNSIRKDLESASIPRICLALDTLIQSPSRDVIPAVQSRLHDLLSYNSLSEVEPEILREIASKARKRLNDPDPSVVCAALTLADTLLKATYLPRDKYHTVAFGLLKAAWSLHPEPTETRLCVRILQTITDLGYAFAPALKVNTHEADLAIIMEIVRCYVPPASTAYPIIHQCFRAVAAASKETVAAVQQTTGKSFVNEIRSLLTSQDPDAQYLFVHCLSSTDPQLWAGITPDVPAVLEEWEVERVMKLLECADRLIRKQTMGILLRIDSNIVESYYVRALQGDLSSDPMMGTEHTLPRLFEILDVLCAGNGEAFAEQLKYVLKAAEGDVPINKRVVVQEAVEEMLSRVHAANDEWRSGCLGVLFTAVVDSESEVGPTLMVIFTALLCEYLVLAPNSPTELLSDLAKRLSLYSAALQDVCIVTMLRISVTVDVIPTAVGDAVKELQSRSGRHLRRRCDQFLTLTQSKDALQHILANTRSSSLPDFVHALEKHEAGQERAVSTSPSILPSSPSLKPYTPEPSSSRASPVPNKLRYAAYDAPRPTPRLRRGSSSSSRNSEEGRRPYQDPIRLDTEVHPQGSPRQTKAISPLPIVQILDEEPILEGGAADLITLDSPFMSEPVALSISSAMSSVIEQDFEATWNALSDSVMRGWCESSMDTMLRRLQGLGHTLRVTERDRPPFEGDLKIVISPKTGDLASKIGLAAIRLKESDDDSCLWWVRCEDESLRNIVKTTLR